MSLYLYTVSYVIQQAVVNRLADVAHGPLGIGRSNDLVCARGILISSEDADLTPGHLLFVDVHRLQSEQKNSASFVSLYMTENSCQIHAPVFFMLVLIHSIQEYKKKQSKRVQVTAKLHSVRPPVTHTSSSCF